METGLAPGCAEVLVWLYMLGGRLHVLHRAGARVMASAAFLGASWIGVVLAGAAVRSTAVMVPAVVVGEAGIRREAVQHSVSTWGFAQMLYSFPMERQVQEVFAVFSRLQQRWATHTLWVHELAGMRPPSRMQHCCHSSGSAIAAIVLPSAPSCRSCGNNSFWLHVRS